MRPCASNSARITPGSKPAAVDLTKGQIPSETRLAAAKRVSTSIVNGNPTLRWGLSRFNQSSSNGGSIVADCGSTPSTVTSIPSTSWDVPVVTDSTEGIPSSRLTTTAWLFRAPTSTTTPAVAPTEVPAEAQAAAPAGA